MCLWRSKRVESSSIDVSDINRLYVSIDVVAADVVLYNGTLRILVVYIPPKVRGLVLSDFLDFLAINYCSKAERTLLIGDFNCPSFVQKNDTVLFDNAAILSALCIVALKFIMLIDWMVERYI